jgi:acetyl esterase/lipase
MDDDASIDNIQTKSLPPTPDPSSDPEDDVFRSFRGNVPKIVQSWLRDSGVIRGVMTLLFWYGVPSVGKKYPWAVLDFLKLAGQENSILFRLAKWWGFDKRNYPEMPGLRDDIVVQTRRIPYGPNARQYVHLITGDTDANSSSSLPLRDHTIIIVHGGAWGSGSPEQFVLAAIPFLNAGYSQIAMVGYRTYPTVDVQGQIDDVVAAIQATPQTSRMTVIGHSSGSHVLSMAFLQGQVRSNIDSFIGLSGVYDIPSHYRWEAARGVERMSPMAPACGLSLSRWKKLSPTRIARQQASNHGTKHPSNSFPPSTLLLHGYADTIVPYTSTEQFAEATGLSWDPVSSTVGHAETICDLMFGGPTREVVLDWLN